MRGTVTIHPRCIGPQLQAGGVGEVGDARAAPGIEALLETYGPELANLLKTPIRPGGLEGVYGSFLPEIAAQDAAQTQAYNLAVAQATGGPGGLGAYTPFINASIKILPLYKF